MRIDPFGSTVVVLVPFLRLPDGTLQRIVQPNAADGSPVEGLVSVRRGLDDAFSTGSVGFGWSGSLHITRPDNGEVIRHTFSANATQPKTKGIGTARPEGKSAPKAKTDGASMYGSVDTDE